MTTRTPTRRPRDISRSAVGQHTKGTGVTYVQDLVLGIVLLPATVSCCGGVVALPCRTAPLAQRTRCALQPYFCPTAVRRASGLSRK